MLRRFTTGVAIAAGLAFTSTGCMGLPTDKAEDTGNAIKLSAAQILGRSATKAAQINTVTMSLDMNGHMADGQVQTKETVQIRLRPQVGLRVKVHSLISDGEKAPPFEMRFTGSTMYMKMPVLQRLNGGRPWTRIPASELGLGGDAMDLQTQLDRMKQQSPVEQIDMLTGSGDVREVGTETIGGVRTRHFSGTLTQAQLMGEMDAKAKRDFESSYGKLGSAPISFDVWIGDDDLPRKVATKWTSARGPLAMTLLYSSYNAPVAIEAPPANQVGNVRMPRMS
jgi:hypothetical protein